MPTLPVFVRYRQGSHVQCRLNLGGRPGGVCLPQDPQSDRDQRAVNHVMVQTTYTSCSTALTVSDRCQALRG